MGFSDKYGYVATTRHGPSGPIGEDEPVALFRAQDRLAVEMLEQYRRRCVEEGCHPDHVSSIETQIDNFLAWQERNSTRTPGPVSQ